MSVKKIKPGVFFLIILAIFLTPAVFAYLYCFHIEPWWISVTTNMIPIRSLPCAFENFKIVHISDIHFGDYLKQNYIKKVINLIGKQQADMIVITGDFVIDNYKELECRVTLLSSLQAKYGVFGVLGNHDYWTDSKKIIKLLTANNIRMLVNDNIRIVNEGESIWLAGVDSVMNGSPNLPKTLRGVPGDAVEILLCHEPDFADEAVNYDIELQLSGHSHGGQLIPFFSAPPVLPRFAKKYHNGLYKAGGLRIYVNRGIGMLDKLPARFNCRPEISVIILKKDTGQK